MLKKLTFSVVALMPTVAMAGGGGGESVNGILFEAVVKAVEKIIAMF